MCRNLTNYSIMNSNYKIYFKKRVAMINKKIKFSLIASALLPITFISTSLALNIEAVQYYNSALDQYIKGNTDESIVLLQKSVKIDPEFSDAYYNLGSIYRYKGVLDKAEEVFQRVLSLKPTDTGVNYDMGLIYIQKNEPKKAINFLKLVNKDSDKYKEAQEKILSLENQLQLPQIKKQKKEITPDTTLVKENSDISITAKPCEHINPKVDIPETTRPVEQIGTKVDIPETAKPIEQIGLKTNTQDTMNIPEQKVLKNSQTDKKTTTEKVLKNEEEIVAVSYMSIESNSGKKLKLSPKNKDDMNTCYSAKNALPPRNAIKTFATGFTGPTGLVSDRKGNFYIADYTGNKIYKVSPNGQKELFASSDDINGPVGMAIDNNENLYVANYLSNSIAKISSTGEISIVATGLNKPYMLYYNNSGKLYVSEQESNSISEINLLNKKGGQY